jgi:hypothetical protein
VQKCNVDFSLEENASCLGSVFGAHRAWAGLVDLPIQNFERHVCPPHLPCGAFVKSQFWGESSGTMGCIDSA